MASERGWIKKATVLTIGKYYSLYQGSELRTHICGEKFRSFQGCDRTTPIQPEIKSLLKCGWSKPKMPALLKREKQVNMIPSFGFRVLCYLLGWSRNDWLIFHILMWNKSNRLDREPTKLDEGVLFNIVTVMKFGFFDGSLSDSLCIILSVLNWLYFPYHLLHAHASLHVQHMPKISTCSQVPRNDL